MSILITGWYGYIWSHIASDLIQAWYDLVILDNLSNSKSTVWASIDLITGKSHAFVLWDILDQSLLHKLFQDYQIDAVVHCAAKKAVGESCEHPFDYYETNIHGTATLLEAMDTAWVKKLLFSSSTTVYDISRSVSPFSEDAPTGGTSSPYGSTKVINEYMTRDVSMHKWFRVLSLRYFNPIGAHPTWLIWEDPAQPPQSLLPILLQTLTGDRDSMSVYGKDYDTPDGTCLRDYIHVVDVASGHTAAIKRLLADDHAIREPVNLGTGTGTSVLDLIQIVEEVTSREIPRSYTDRRAGDVPIAYADTTKAKKLLWWEPTLTITQAVQDAWTFWNQHFDRNA